MSTDYQTIPMRTHNQIERTSMYDRPGEIVLATEISDLNTVEHIAAF